MGPFCTSLANHTNTWGQEQPLDVILRSLIAGYKEPRYRASDTI